MICINTKENKLTDGSKVYDVVLWEEKYDLVGNQKYLVLANATDKKAAQQCVDEIKSALAKAEGIALHPTN